MKCRGEKLFIKNFETTLRPITGASKGVKWKVDSDN